MLPGVSWEIKTSVSYTHLDVYKRQVYVFLSNRIYPEVWNAKLLKSDIRERIQEAMYRAVLKLSLIHIFFIHTG